MKIYYKILKLMFINNYCTDFMFEEVIVCVTYSSSILSPLFAISFKFSRYHNNLLKFMSTGFNFQIYS